MKYKGSTVCMCVWIIKKVQAIRVSHVMLVQVNDDKLAEITFVHGMHSVRYVRWILCSVHRATCMRDERDY